MSTTDPSPSSRGQIQRPATVRRYATSSVAVHPQEDDGEISLGFIIRVWKQWWKWLIPISLMLTAASAVIVILTFQPKFRSSARIEIAEQAPWVIQQDTDQRALQYVATQIEMLRGARVLNSVLEDPKIANMPDLAKKRDPVTWLSEKGLQIQSVGQSTLVEVAFEGLSPSSSAYLVNKVVENYFVIQDDQKSIRNQGVLKAIRASRTMQSDHVTRLQKLVKQYSKDLDVVPNLTGQIDLTMRNATPAQVIMDQIRLVDFEIDDLEAGIVALQQSLSNDAFPVTQSLVQAQIDQLPEVKARRLEIQQKEAMLGQIATRAARGESSTAYINTQQEIKQLRSALDLLRAESESSIVQQVRDMDRLELESSLKVKRTDLMQKREKLCEAGRTLHQ